MKGLLLFILAHAYCIHLFSQQNLFANSLQHGKYPVGFKTILTYDKSRPAVAEQPPGKRGGRFMQINVWYPAKPSASELMQYEVYVHLLASQTHAFSGAGLSSISKQAFFARNAELGADTGLLAGNYMGLIKSKTKAQKNVVVATGKFPVLIYPDFATTQSILCEYLASHGYIVASTPMKGTYSVNFDLGISGVETEISDLQFVLATVREQFPVMAQFAVMGLGIHASAALGLQMRNEDVAAMISLEGGITTQFEFGLIRKSPYFNLERINKPMLIIHAPHRDVKPELTDVYKYADRWLVGFPQSSEYYFLNYGIWEGSMKGILGKAPGNTRLSSEWAAGYVLHFLDHIFKKDTKADDFKLDNKAPAGLLSTSFRKRIAPPPSMGELMQVYDKKGIEGLKEIYEKQKQADQYPFSSAAFYTVGQQLMAEREYEKALQWIALFKETYPSAAAPWFMSGRCEMELGNRAIAKTQYLKALEMLNGDGELTCTEKEYYKPIIENRIKELSS